MIMLLSLLSLSSSVKFLTFIFLIIIDIDKFCCTIIFPTVNLTQFRQNFRNLNNASRVLRFNKNRNIYTPKQFGVLTRRKFADNTIDFADNTINLCQLKNCQQNNLIIEKNRELLKIRRDNSLDNKLSNYSNDLSLRNMKIGNNNQSLLKLSSLVQNAADMLKLFEKIANPTRNTQYTEQIIQRRQLMRQLSAPIEFRSGRKALSVKPLIESSLDNTPTVVFKGNHQSKTIAEDTAWAELLFGPRGVLTAVFHILDDRRKITEKIRSRTAINNKNSNDNSQTTNTYHQSDLSLLPDFLIDASGVRTHEDLRPLELKSNALTTRPSLLQT